MNATEFFKKIDKIVAKYENEYEFIGIRFEDKLRTIGEVIVDFSKSNLDREDVRDFPEYGTEEYNSMEILDGVCAYNAADTNREGFNPVRSWKKENEITDITRCFMQDHCYILGCDYLDNGDKAEDCNEIIMKNAVVIDVLY